MMPNLPNLSIIQRGELINSQETSAAQSAPTLSSVSALGFALIQRNSPSAACSPSSDQHGSFIMVQQAKVVRMRGVSQEKLDCLRVFLCNKKNQISFQSSQSNVAQSISNLIYSPNS